MVLLLILLLLSFPFIQTSLQNENIFKIITEFHLNDPFLIGSINDISWKLIKLLSKNGHFINVKQEIGDFSFNEEINSNIIIFVNYETRNLDLPKNDYHNLMLISKDDTFEEILNSVAAKCQINQKIFLLKADSLEIYEAYTINNVAVKKIIGNIDRVANNYRWQTEVNPDFVERRSDFQGIILKGMVEFWGLLMNADKSYLEKAPYFSNNETYEITGFTHGVYHDILISLQDRLNFTTVLYKRKDGLWGHVKDKNGSYEGIGIIGDIFSRRADFAVAAFMMTMNRAILVNFLPSINEGTCGIYIPAKNIESITFEKYLAPFTLSLWIAIAFSGVTFAISKFLLLKVHVCEAAFGFDDIWISFSCFLGRAPTPTSIDKKSSYKTMIIATLLCGSVIWMAYNGELTSELAILKKKYPFDDMESFSKTNWR